MEWVLILAMIGGSGDGGVSLHSIPFSTKEECITAGRGIRMNVWREPSWAKATFYCAPNNTLTPTS